MKERPIIENQIIEIIDRLKGLCHTCGLSNQAAEEEIVTSVFLYKYLSDNYKISAICGLSIIRTMQSIKSSAFSSTSVCMPDVKISAILFPVCEAFLKAHILAIVLSFPFHLML